MTLASSQRGRDHREPIDVSALTATALQTARAKAETLGLKLRTQTAAPTTGDPRLIGRLVANLLDNAVDYSNPGGRGDIITGATADGAFL